MIVLKYQESTTEKFFENARDNLSFWGWGGKTFSKKIGVWWDSPNLYFMFLIDMKFISKLLYILLMENKLFSNPHLRKNIFGEIFWKSKMIYQKKGGFAFQKLRKVSKFQILRYQKIIFFKDESMIFLVCFEVFWW